MDSAIRLAFADILACISRIESYMNESTDYEFFKSNTMLQDALERNLITIGEAMRIVLKNRGPEGIRDARLIADARNFLTHSYRQIEKERVWGIIIDYVPILKKDVLLIIENESSS